MTTITAARTHTHRRPNPTSTEKLLLSASQRLESFAVARMERRATRINPETEKARQVADDRRRNAQALGALGLLP